MHQLCNVFHLSDSKALRQCQSINALEAILFELGKTHPSPAPTPSVTPHPASPVVTLHVQFAQEPGNSLSSSPSMMPPYTYTIEVPAQMDGSDHLIAPHNGPNMMSVPAAIHQIQMNHQQAQHISLSQIMHSVQMIVNMQQRTFRANTGFRLPQGECPVTPWTPTMGKNLFATPFLNAQSGIGPHPNRVRFSYVQASDPDEPFRSLQGGYVRSRKEFMDDRESMAPPDQLDLSFYSVGCT